jgi:hypothetical protein
MLQAAWRESYWIVSPNVALALIAPLVLVGVCLWSGLIDHNQKMTVAAMTMAEKKVWAQRS